MYKVATSSMKTRVLSFRFLLARSVLEREGLRYTGSKIPYQTLIRLNFKKILCENSNSDGKILN